jgi:site-specific recombinase XerD
LTHGAHVTFGAYFESWLKAREDAILRGEITPQTLCDNRKKGRALCRYFGKARLTSITSPLVRDYLSDMAKADKSGTTRRHHFTLLRQILTQAKYDGLVRTNPCDQVKPPGTDTEEKRALDPPQVREMLTALEATGSRMYIPASCWR